MPLGPELVVVDPTQQSFPRPKLMMADAWQLRFVGRYRFDWLELWVTILQHPSINVRSRRAERKEALLSGNPSRFVVAMF